jgi:hypothetical protein
MIQPRHAALAAIFLAFGVSAALAQQPPVRVRGTIESVQGDTIVVRNRDGTELSIKLADNVRVAAMVKATFADIKPGSFVGSAALPQPDGTYLAVSLHIFSDAQRGVVREGFTPWDLQPNSTMTNAIVEGVVVGADRHRLTLKYPDGEKIIVVPADLAVAAYAPGDRSELKPGAKVFIFAAQRQADGSLLATAVSVGRDGLTPPM